MINVVNKLVPFDAVRKNKDRHRVYLLREIHAKRSRIQGLKSFAPNQLMLEPLPLGGRQVKLEESKLDGWHGKCGNPWCGTGEWSITFNGNENAEFIPSINKLLNMGSGRNWLEMIGNCILVQGGHFIPNLKDASAPYWASYGLKIALNTIEAAQSRGKQADLFILVNDLHMGKRVNNREEYWFNFQLPAEMQDMISACKERAQKDFRVIVAGESFLSNHVQKYVIPKLNSEVLGKIADIVVERNEKKRTEADMRQSGQKRCTAALTQLLSIASRFYDGFVQVYPACGRGQGERALDVFRLVFEDSGPSPFNVLSVYAGKKCWGASQLNATADQKAREFLTEFLGFL